MNIGKKLLSLLTVFCLTLSLVPTVALASTNSPSSVKINNSVEMVGQGITYYSASGSFSTTEPSTWIAKYEPSIHKLTLKKYTGGPICANGDLTIYLDSKNEITSGDNGINLGYGSFSASNASLTIEGSGSLEVTSAQNSTVYTTGNITIQGGANVKINGGRSGQAIHAVGGQITIQGNNTKVITIYDENKSGEVRSGSGNGTINIKDGATLQASGIGGELKINGRDASNDEKNQISQGITADLSVPTYTISGTVKNIDEQGIADANVQLAPTVTANAGASAVISDSTDAEGRYNLSGISAGTYKLTVTADGYNTYSDNNVSLNNSTYSISKNIELSSSTYRVEIGLSNDAHMTRTDSSGDLIQNVTKNSAINQVVFTADQGYYFSNDYASKFTALNGLTITRDDSGKTITISGTPTEDTTINLTSLMQKTAQEPFTCSNFNVSDCTNESDNNGSIAINKITADSKIEYQKKSDPSDTASNSWTEVSFTGSDATISGLTPGTYLIRYKETDTKNASTPWEITILGYTPYNVWVHGIPVTQNNKSDILGDGRTVSYNSETGTLTLNNATINNTASPTVALGGSTKSYAERAGIFTTGNLTIHVTGNSSIKSTYGNAIKGKGNLTISGTGSLTLNSLEDMSSLSLDYDSSTLIIKDAVNITAIVDLSRPLGPGNVSAGISVSAYNTTIQDFANVTAINKGTGLALYSPNNITVKNSAILTAQSKQKGNATSAITYPGHTVTASTTFDGSSSGGSTEPYNPTKLNTYKYVKVEPITVTGVELNKDSLSIKVGQSETLSATLQPSGAVQDVTWTSSDDKIVTVTNGTVTAVGVGTATITVTTADGSHTASCTVTVTRTSSSGSGSHTTYYPVNTPAKSEGGSVVVSPKSASKGAAVTVTVTPESGYQVSSVQAVDKDGKKLTLTDKGDGKYTFVMPGSKVEVSASFAQVQKPEEPSPYRDVSKDSYYYDAVQWASDKGITNGVADGVFAPDWVCTRGQIVTFLWRSVGSPAPKTTEMPFADVAEDAYYAQAVLWAVENGITKGTSETTFSPDQTCTRAHAVAFLYRLAGSPAVTGSSFQDVAADAYYNAAVAWAVQQGITNGTSETTFSPDETCTRAQIVTFLYRMDQAK